MLFKSARIEELEAQVGKLKVAIAESTLIARQQHWEAMKGLSAISDQITVPRVRDGEKIAREKPGAYRGSNSAHLKEISVASAVLMLAEKLGVELVYQEDVPGELRAVGQNEYSDVD